jgi:disulfide oxidoreductase YuzD
MSIKDLSTYITEEILIEIINRSDMPQIKGNDIPTAIDTFKKYGVPFKYEVNKVNDLNPIQNNVNADKIERISIAIKSGNKMNPIFISNDNYIVDGHHRWLAYKNLNKDEIECIKIGYSKMAALQLFDKIADKI